MPNGHGGVPYLGGPILFAIMFITFARVPFGNDGWFVWIRIAICVLLAAAIGWRIAYYVHMYDADEYGGAYTPPDFRRQATHRYWIAAPIYAVVTAIAGLGILRWFGVL